VNYDWTVQMPWLAACLVGDGSLRWSPERPARNPELRLEHAVADEGWLEFKTTALREELGLDDDQLKLGKVDVHGARQATLSSPVFRPIWNELYNHGDRGVDGRRYKQLLDWPYRNPENILRLFWCWYLDDGSMRLDGYMRLGCYQSELEMQGFVDALKTAFQERHGIKVDPTIYRHSKPNKTIPGNEYGLRFSTYETAQILPTYSDYLPVIGCMQRKLVMPENKSGKRRIRAHQLSLQGPIAITPEQGLAIDSMSKLELRAFVMAIGIGHPRMVNGKRPDSKADYLGHIREHTCVAA